jgi:hypothetical protein
VGGQAHPGQPLPPGRRIMSRKGRGRFDEALMNVFWGRLVLCGFCLNTT